MLWSAKVVLLLLLALGADATTTLDAIDDYAFTWPGETSFVTSRLSARNRTLLLDGQVVLLRGTTYSPTPIGKDMASSFASLRVADFFVTGNAEVWKRDLPLMAKMGANAVRVYELRETGDHSAFLDFAHKHNITVIAGFPLHNDKHDLRDVGAANANPNHDDLNRAETKDRIRATVLANAHPAIGMWLVGNEARAPPLASCPIALTRPAARSLRRRSPQPGRPSIQLHWRIAHRDAHHAPSITTLPETCHSELTQSLPPTHTLADQSA